MDRCRTFIRKYLTHSHILVKLMNDVFYNRVNLVVEICCFGLLIRSLFSTK